MSNHGRSGAVIFMVPPAPKSLLFIDIYPLREDGRIYYKQYINRERLYIKSLGWASPAPVNDRFPNDGADLSAFLTSLDASRRDRFEELAAKLEYELDQPRWLAEALAAGWVSS